MKKTYSILLLLCYLVSSCNQSEQTRGVSNSQLDTIKKTVNKPQASIDTSKKGIANVADISSESLLEGIWVAKGEQNASFKIDKKTFYYLDDNVHVPYEMKGDSVLLRDEEGIQSFSIKFRGRDTLLMSSIDGIQVFSRRSPQ